MVSSYGKWLLAHWPNPQARRLPPVSNSWLIIQNICSYPPHLKTVSSTCNMKMSHTVMTIIFSWRTLQWSLFSHWEGIWNIIPFFPIGMSIYIYCLLHCFMRLVHSWSTKFKITLPPPLQILLEFLPNTETLFVKCSSW